MRRYTLLAILLCLGSNIRAEEKACRKELSVLVETLFSVRYTCTSRCSKDNLWMGFGGASGSTAQKAYDALADMCERSGMHLVNSQLSCIASYSAASFHEDMDADCEARKKIVALELTTPRLRCRAAFSSRNGWPYDGAVDAANADAAWREFAKMADYRGFSFKSFKPASDCAALAIP